MNKTVEICNKRGLHARAAAKFVKMVETFQADVTVEKDGSSVAGGSIMGLLMLSASIGTEITISAQGVDAERAVENLAALVARKFDEAE